MTKYTINIDKSKRITYKSLVDKIRELESDTNKLGDLISINSWKEKHKGRYDALVRSDEKLGFIPLNRYEVKFYKSHASDDIEKIVMTGNENFLNNIKSGITTLLTHYGISLEPNYEKKEEVKTN